MKLAFLRHGAATALLSVTAVLLTGCGDTKPVAAPVTASVPPLELAAVDVETVTRGTLSGGLPVSGVLQPLVQTTVQAQVAAEVKAVLVREGERVEKGQVLARLGTEALEARVKQAEAVLTSAKVEATLSRALVDRNRKLMEKNYFSEVDYQKGVGEAEAREEAARAQQALLDIARKAYADASVKAPQAGVVARRYVEPGSNIGMDGRLFDIVDLAEMELALPVPATDIAMVKTGQRVNFTVGGFGSRRFEGRVVRISPVADAGTRAISTYVRVSNPAADLRGGMYARGEIVTGNGVEGLVVPLEALHTDESGQLWVLVLEKERLVRRNVVSTSRDVRQNQALVSSGLTEGETVIVARLDESAINQPARLVR